MQTCCDSFERQWPLPSSDLTPLDYSVWATFEAEVNKIELGIMSAKYFLHQMYIKHACILFRPHLLKVFATKLLRQIPTRHHNLP